LLNSLRTRCFAEEELQRTKTDKVDAVSIARFAAQKRPAATALRGPAIEELKQLMFLREQSVQHMGDRVRHLHQALDLTFPEFTRHVRGLDTELATAILSRYPTAQALRTISVRKLARLCYDGRHRIGDVLARALIEAAKISAGHYSSEPYQLQVRYACEDIISLRTRVRRLATDIELRLNTHEVGKLLTTIPGVSTLTAARIIAETGDPAQFRSAAAFASYIGAVPRLHQSGKKRYSGKPAIPLGNARLRRALWMPVLAGIRVNPWLRTYLPTPPQRGQTSQGRHHCRYAQTAHCDLQCCQTSNAIRSASSCYVDMTARDQPYADRGNRGHVKRTAEFS